MTYLRASRRTYAFLTTLSTSGSRLGVLPSISSVNALVPSHSHRPIDVYAFSQQRLTPRCLSSSSTFQAPEPPESTGHPIFPDVDIWSSKPPTKMALERNSDPHAIFVVNGSSRGIGLQMVQSLLDRTKGTIIACCRNPEDPKSALQAFLSSASEDITKRVQTYALDLENQASIDALAEYLKSNDNQRVDGLFNVAGILGDASSTPGPERSLAQIERDWLEHSFQVNVVGHVMLIKALKQMMRSKGSSKTPARPTSVIINLSARVGSISDNGLGGWYSYRMSKAALNQATRTMAHELKRQGTLAIAVHPGTTDTGLSKPFQKNVKPEKLFPVDFTVHQILDVVDRLEEVHSGGLYDWAGKAIPF